MRIAPRRPRHKRRAMLRMALGVLVGTCLGLGGRCIGADDGSDWPRWRGERFNGVSAERGVFDSGGFELQVRWRRKLGSGYSGVVVRDGHAITMFSSDGFDIVACLEAESGAEHWRFPIAATFPGREGANDGPVSTPAIDDTTVFALGPRGDFVAIDLESGELSWRTHLVEDLQTAVPHWGISTSPLVVADTVVVGTGGDRGAITGFDKRSGEIRWRVGSDEVNYQSPILWTLDGEELVVGAGDTTLFGIRPSDGTLVWRFVHGGSGFYREIVNPVVIGPRELMLTNQRMASTSFSVLKGSGDIGVRQNWSSRHLKRSYATPVFFDGHVYGFSGAILSSIDATTGELNWRSRPPGDGFPILVDGHLVVLTKRGTLHVVAADPSGYRELASLEVLPHVTWTPPAFAGGRVYARDSFADFVAVDVVDGDRSTTGRRSPTATSVTGLSSGTAFASWVDGLEKAPDKEREIQRFLAAQSSFPLIENARWAHVAYHGEGHDIAVRGGMLGAKTVMALHRVPGTDFHFASFELPPDARLQYQLVRDLEELILDPLNPDSSGSLVHSGRVSILSMPEAEAGVPARARGAGVGRIETVPFETEKVAVGSLTWGGPRAIDVYLPHGYAQSEATRYPTLYVLYGREMLNEGRFDTVLDALIGSEVEPLIAVFIESTSAYEYARSPRELHARMVIDDIVPLIDQEYRTIAEAGGRAIYGVDEGGFAALEMAVRHPGAFGKVAAQSLLAIGSGGDELVDAIVSMPGPPLVIYLDWGRFDYSNDATETDIPGYSRRVAATLRDAGYTVSGREWNDSSDVAIWFRRLPHVLRSLFPIAR